MVAQALKNVGIEDLKLKCQEKGLTHHSENHGFAMNGKNVGFFTNICSPKNLALIILELQEEVENG